MNKKRKAKKYRASGDVAAQSPVVTFEDAQSDSGRTLVFDCFSGIAGDMTLAALIDAGASRERILQGLAGLGLPSFELRTEQVARGGLRALHLRLELSEERTFQPAEMRERVEGAALADRVGARSLATIDELVFGESLAHGTDEPHLHEAGGVDALIDIVETMLALEDLGVDTVICPVVTAGSGTIARAAHGVIPAAPGPAAAHILQRAGFRLRFVDAGHELVTPTGAAILAAVARPGPAALTMVAQGAGAGTFDPPGRPNALRVFLGRTSAAARGGRQELRRVVLLEANIDDMPATLLANARDRLLEEGALDAWLEPIAMKKGRAATKLCAPARPAEEERLADIFLAETTTLGVRVAGFRRYEAARAIETARTSLGEVRVKRSRWHDLERAALEYDDVIALAAAHQLPAREIQRRLEAELNQGGPNSAS